MTSLIDLQRRQRAHDEVYHRDIYFLSHQERFKHIAFHFGKYSGKLATALKLLRSSGQIDSYYDPAKTLTDSFIIVLNCAEIFSLDLDSTLRKKVGLRSNNPEFRRFVDDIVDKSDLYPKLKDSNRERVLENLLIEYTIASQSIAKACDSLDHMEGIDREKITESLLEILLIIIIAGHSLAVDFELTVPQRWKQIEEKKVL